MIIYKKKLTAFSSNSRTKLEVILRKKLQDATLTGNYDLLAKTLQNTIHAKSDFKEHSLAPDLLIAGNHLFNAKEHLEIALHAFNVASWSTICPQIEKRATKSFTRTLVKFIPSPGTRIAYLRDYRPDYISKKLRRAVAKCFINSVFQLPNPIRRAELLEVELVPWSNEITYLQRRSLEAYHRNASELPDMHKIAAYRKIKDRYAPIDSQIHKDAIQKYCEVFLKVAEKEILGTPGKQAKKINLELTRNYNWKRNPAVPSVSVFGLNQQAYTA